MDRPKAVSYKIRPRIEVEKSAFLDGLVALARMPKLPKKKKALLLLILSLDGDELVLSTGIYSVRLTARGMWPTPAVLHYSMFGILTSLAESTNEKEPVVIEALEHHLHIGAAKVPCSYHDPKTNVRGVVDAERELQRVSEFYVPESDSHSIKDYGKVMVLSQLRDLYPTFEILPSERLTVVVIPELPRVLLRLTSRMVEFRFVNDPDIDTNLWFEQSTLWKALAYRTVEELRLSNLLLYAADASNKNNSIEGAPV